MAEAVKPRSLFLSFFILILFQGMAQTNSPAGSREAVVSLKEQAGHMGQAFLSGDYKSFVSYVYPKLVAGAGGPAKMEAQLVKIGDAMRSRNMQIRKISFGDVSPVVRSGSELQCTIPQYTDIGIP